MNQSMKALKRYKQHARRLWVRKLRSADKEVTDELCFAFNAGYSSCLSIVSKKLHTLQSSEEEK